MGRLSMSSKNEDFNAPPEAITPLPPSESMNGKLWLNVEEAGSTYATETPTLISSTGL